MRLEWSQDDGVDGLRLVGARASGGTALRDLTAQELARRLPVYPTELVRDDAASPGAVASGAVPPVGGRYLVDDGDVCFVPRYPFLDRTSYTMLVHRSIDDPAVPAENFDLEDYEQLAIEREGPSGQGTARVVDIFPTSPQIPRNQLKMYVHFSAPMSEGCLAEHLRIRRADTRQPLAHVFLPMEQELWDPTGRRATVLFDPARIKRGLDPHRELGYPLEIGDPIEIVVDDGFRDADGRGLAVGFERRYEVGGDVRALVDPECWSVTPIRSRTTEPVVVTFDRPLDHALLHHCLGVVGPAGEPVRGRAQIGAHESSWSFVPDAPWAGGEHRLLVDTMLEDLAGNSVARVFDRELARSDHAPLGVDQIVRELRSA